MCNEVWDSSLFRKEESPGPEPLRPHAWVPGEYRPWRYEPEPSEYNDWTISGRDRFAESYMLTSTRVLPSPVQCCPRCSALLDDTSRVTYPGIEISATAAQRCQVCTLLLRQSSYDGRGVDDVEIDIVRRGAALRKEATGVRLLRLCRDTANLKEISSYTPLGLPIPSRDDGRPDFGLLRAWLNWCDEKHNCMKSQSNGDVPLPKRLLYVGAVDESSYSDFLRLELGSDIPAGTKYTALSHRWGKLSNEEKNTFCTSTENINKRRKQFSLSGLPKTFRDAVEATRQLRIPYLWIDSLCIIQYGDNGEDWRREAQQMETVFSAAYCVIAATSATDWNTGFLERAWTAESLYVESAAGQQLYVGTDIDDFDKDVGDAELNRRAWVMQESVLARRTIHFTAKQIYFECGEGVYCENLIKLECRPFRKKDLTLDPNFPSRLVGTGYQNTAEFIRLLIEDYSKRGLTQKTDRCVAMSGLHTRIARTIGCDGRYGTLETYLHRNLLWHASDLKLQRIEHESYVPSWSWMAYDGGIRLQGEKELPVGQVHWITSLRFDKGRDCDHALIADVGVFKDCKIELEGSRHAVFDLAKTNRGWIRYDVEDGKNLLEEHCVVVGSTENSEDYYILLVRPTAVDGEYERVGMGQVSKNCLVRTRANVRVV